MARVQRSRRRASVGDRPDLPVPGGPMGFQRGVEVARGPLLLDREQRVDTREPRGELAALTDQGRLHDTPRRSAPLRRSTLGNALRRLDVQHAYNSRSSRLSEAAAWALDRPCDILFPRSFPDRARVGVRGHSSARGGQWWLTYSARL